MTTFIKIGEKAPETGRGNVAAGRRFVHAADCRVACADCCMKRLCIVSGSEDGEEAGNEKLVNHWHPMAKRRHVFREGDVFRSLFFIRSGSLKSYQTLENGEEQVTGFHFPGEVLGFDGISDSTHRNAAVAMETTSVCEIPFRRLFAEHGNAVAMEQRFLSLLSESFNRKDLHSLMLTKNKAHERIAAFLMDLSQSFARRRLSADSFPLPMFRAEIANYMGLTTESVSRVFSRFNREGVVTSSGHHIEIDNPQALAAYAGMPFEAPLRKAV
jgi:CRP/FNR family transcriptional regulator